jgi:hypothetical protein
LGDADVGVLVEALLGIDPDVGEPALADLVLELFEVVPALVFVEERVGQRFVDGVPLVVVDDQAVLNKRGEKIKKNRFSNLRFGNFFFHSVLFSTSFLNQGKPRFW